MTTSRNEIEIRLFNSRSRLISNFIIAEHEKVFQASHASLSRIINTSTLIDTFDDSDAVIFSPKVNLSLPKVVQ